MDDTGHGSSQIPSRSCLPSGGRGGVSPRNGKSQLSPVNDQSYVPGHCSVVLFIPLVEVHSTSDTRTGDRNTCIPDLGPSPRLLGNNEWTSTLRRREKRNTRVVFKPQGFQGRGCFPTLGREGGRGQVNLPGPFVATHLSVAGPWTRKRPW